MGIMDFLDAKFEKMDEKKQEREAHKPIKVVVTDVNISILNLAGLMIKACIAAIPAAIIIALFYFVFGGILLAYFSAR